MYNDTLLKKWLNNDLTKEEEKVFISSKDYDLNTEIIQTAKLFKASNVIKPINFKTFKSRYHANKKPVIKLNYRYTFLKIASVFLLLFSINYIFFNNKLETTETLASQKTTIELPDYSIVEISPNSTVSYVKNNWKKKRIINLNGEAFFKVAKGKKFDVITNDGIITVVGTAFSVKQRNQYFEVICFEGIVKVNTKNKEKVLKVGDRFQIYNNVYSEEISNNLSTKFQKNNSVFQAISLKDVFLELERQYNIKVTLNYKDLNRLFVGSFTHNNLETALLSITKPMNLTYSINSKNNVTINVKKN
ncbi:MAG: FecR family protein [Flavobacteriaceae bacterium]|nr:FecR family protein [Flavobacteriaceae bacterium]